MIKYLVQLLHVLLNKAKENIKNKDSDSCKYVVSCCKVAAAWLDLDSMFVDGGIKPEQIQKINVNLCTWLDILGIDSAVSNENIERFVARIGALPLVLFTDTLRFLSGCMQRSHCPFGRCVLGCRGPSQNLHFLECPIVLDVWRSLTAHDSSNLVNTILDQDTPIGDLVGFCCIASLYKDAVCGSRAKHDSMNVEGFCDPAHIDARIELKKAAPYHCVVH